tara:strand:+ start:505 stop:702 length:198 start_codon:yes stop_codon:yes gene_type:complete
MIGNKQEWAEQFIKAGANLEVVNRELICCGIQASNPEEAKAVREEFTRQTLDAMDVAKRAKIQFK